jgi:hypothetical protein
VGERGAKQKKSVNRCTDQTAREELLRSIRVFPGYQRSFVATEAVHLQYSTQFGQSAFMPWGRLTFQR